MEQERENNGSSSFEDSDQGEVKKKLFGATALLFLARQWGGVATVLTLTVLARELSLESLGRFTFYLSLFAFLESFVDFGSGTLTLKQGAASATKFNQALASARKLRLTTGAFAFLVIALSAHFLERDRAGWIVLAGLYPLTRCLETSSLVYQVHVRFDVPVAIRTAVATCRALTLIVLVSQGHTSPGPLIAVHAAWTSVGHSLQHLFAGRRLRALPKSASSPLVPFFFRALPLALTGVLQQGYFYIDNLLIRGMLGEEALGLYNASARLFSGLALLAAYATTAALPWFARQDAKGQLESALRGLQKPLLIGGVCSVLFLWPFAEPALVLIFGPGFEAAAGSLRWLLVGVCFVSVGAAPLTALIAKGLYWSVASIACVALVLNLVVNFVLLPTMGIQGAAIATVLSEAAVAGASLLLLRQQR